MTHRKANRASQKGHVQEKEDNRSRSPARPNREAFTNAFQGQSSLLRIYSRHKTIWRWGRGAGERVELDNLTKDTDTEWTQWPTALVFEACFPFFGGKRT